MLLLATLGYLLGYFWHLFATFGLFQILSATFMEAAGHLAFGWLLQDGGGAQYRGCGWHPSLTMHLPKFCPEAENIQTWPAGRAKISNYVIKESDKGGSKWLNGVSKCVYDIVMNSTGVFLRENSSNSTGVNSSKVGEKSIGLSSKTQRSAPRLLGS